MWDLNSPTFDRPGRRSPGRLTVRLPCQKTQRTPNYRGCWLRRLTWCRRRRPRRRPREPERVPGVRCYRTHRPMTPRRTPPAKTRRRKKRPLPQWGERRKGRPPQLGRLEGPRREGPFLRTTPPTPMMAKRSGHRGLSPWRHRKCPDSRIIHGVLFVT